MTTESTDSRTQMLTSIYTVEVTDMFAFYDNDTVGEPDPNKNSWLPMEFQITALWFVFAVSVVGNLLVFQWMRFNWHRKSRVNTIVLGIASADLSVSLFAIMPTAVIESSGPWTAGNATCKIVMYIQGAALISSGNMIAIMAIDRHQAVRSPLSAFIPAWKLVLGAWAAACVLAVPQFFIWLVKERSGRLVCGTILSKDQPGLRMAYLTYVAFITFLVPFGIISVAYVRLCKTIWEKSRECSGKQRHGQIELRRVPTGTLTKAKKKTLKMTIVIIAVFVLCGSPYFIVEMLRTYRAELLSPGVYNLFSIFAVTNSALNPFVFLFFNVTTRFWKDMFPCVSKSSPEATYNRYSVKFSSSNSRQHSKSYGDPHTRATDLESGVTINCTD
ncbi:cardioacceleratory peptide receptor-like [Acanthaster planci]|uniref:Cardioacceleratory peptide receptor-like n=1 Tax=Acanthaster planci TaxID=133434 RepID=A0A8B7ZVQ5_ACAPL|nr:cardioacceleratory peptide receptor-like [Acanthaster planci]XP_022109632.1 cardioacceleratory peptide receptor-like [Acanthaster planci]XP_022109633.1 cardioacceleratory peptide receptor-like [Acanthaster planci]XP_022109634.1 cardioacceleratory peptide receptor-like [Acanthaster planci]